MDEGQAASAIGALLPALQGGLRNSAQQGGFESLLGAMTGGGFSQYAEDPSLMAVPETTQQGNDILGQLLGSKDVSRQVAASASAQTGIGADVLKQMLPLVATMLMGNLSSRAGQSGLSGPAGGAQGGDLMGSLLGMLDADKDGSVADDIAGLAQKFLK
jgi:hypothetical protein